MKQIDFKKELSQYYKPAAHKMAVVNIPEMNFLTAEGEGDPNTSSLFQETVEALFSLSYALKFMIKKGPAEVDYGVMPLEGLWWADDMSSFDVEDKSGWKWTLLVMQPHLVTAELVAKARSQVEKKKNLPALPNIRFEAFREGKAVQTLHIGPFSEEGPLVEELHNFIDEKGYRRSGKHHEIYLSDIRRAAPEKWKTILRQPYSEE